MEPSAAGYLPFDERPFRLRMGLRPLDLDHWLEVDDERDAELAEKRRLLAIAHDDVIAVLDAPGVEGAAGELEDLIDEWLVAHGVSPEGRDASLHPIERCGRNTQEDWCLLVDLDGSGPVLAAASVCFPTRWVLREKLGRSTAAIHAPVAFYDDQLAVPVDRFLERLASEAPMWRLNWNLLDDGALHQPVAPAAETAGADGEGPVQHRVWLRVERQTLRRLPVSRAIAFSIRVHQQRVETLEGRPDVLARLAAAMDALPEPTRAYKGLPRFAGELRAWIDASVLRGSSGRT